MKKHEPKYIEVEGIMRACFDSFVKTNNQAYKEIALLVEEVPAADVQEVRHGRWVENEFGAYCSECGLYAYRSNGIPWKSDYCPNCGASMRGEDDE